MLFVDKAWKIVHLQSELDKWVRFKRRQADRVSELPNAEALSSIFSEGIRSAANGSRIPLASALVDGIFTYEPEPRLAVICYNRPTGTALIDLPVILRNEEEDGKSYAYVWGLGAPKILEGSSLTEESTLEDVFYYGASLVDQAEEKDPIARWMNFPPDQFRQRNPICPSCGSSGVYIGEFCKASPSGRRTMEKRACCSACDWTSKSRYSYLSDFTETAAFKRERQHVLSRARAEDTVSEAAQAAQEALKRLYALTEDKVLLHHAGYQLETGIKTIAKEAAAVAEELKKRL